MIAIRLIWNRQVVPLGDLGLRDVYVDPETEYPQGRKGMVLAQTWLNLGERASGMLIVDGDVVVDPYDMTVMSNAVSDNETAIHVAPARLWPKSTGNIAGIWAHGHDVYGGESEEPTTRFTFCFTYLPADLIYDCIDAGLRQWAYPDVDRNVSQVAARRDYHVNIVEDATPKHLNF